jgi:hypothetical protein
VYRTTFRKTGALLFLAWLLAGAAPAQENYFITYTHHMEEPGNLEFAAKSVSGFPRAGNAFMGNAVEVEYGVKAWWSSELYLDSQTTANESSLFTGFRFENRFRPLLKEHWINPVLYAEFEDINSADKALLEVVGHDGAADFLGRNDRSQKKREVELKLILGSWRRAPTLAASAARTSRSARSCMAGWAIATASACMTPRIIWPRPWPGACRTGRRSAFRRPPDSTATVTGF